MLASSLFNIAGAVLVAVAVLSLVASGEGVFDIVTGDGAGDGAGDGDWDGDGDGDGGVCGGQRGAYAS